MGVELASMGDQRPEPTDDEVVQFSEPRAACTGRRSSATGSWRGVSCSATSAVGADADAGCSTGDAAARDRARTVLPAAGRPRRGASLADLPDDAQICDCNGVCKGTDRRRRSRPGSVRCAVGKATRAGTGCGSCKKLVKGLIEAVAGGGEGRPGGDGTSRRCRWTSRRSSRAIRERGLKSVSAVLARTGRRRRGQRARPASRRCSRASGARSTIDERDARFVNDRVHANIQKDGTFSVVPRIYGGVTSADDLIRIGEVAKKYDVPMVKFTGGQRIDLLGIKKEDLPRRVARPRDAERVRLHEGASAPARRASAASSAATARRQHRPRHRHREAVPGVRVPGEGEARRQRAARGTAPKRPSRTSAWSPPRAASGRSPSAAPPGRTSARPTCSAASRRTRRRCGHRPVPALLPRQREVAGAHLRLRPARRHREAAAICRRRREGICAALDAEMQTSIDAYVDPWLEAVGPAHPTQFSSVVAAPR